MSVPRSQVMMPPDVSVMFPQFPEVQGRRRVNRDYEERFLDIELLRTNKPCHEAEVRDVTLWPSSGQCPLLSFSIKMGIKPCLNRNPQK